jgi:hypothetical protein
VFVVSHVSTQHFRRLDYRDGGNLPAETLVFKAAENNAAIARKA